MKLTLELNDTAASARRQRWAFFWDALSMAVLCFLAAGVLVALSL